MLYLIGFMGVGKTNIGLKNNYSVDIIGDMTYEVLVINIDETPIIIAKPNKVNFHFCFLE